MRKKLKLKIIKRGVNIIVSKNNVGKKNLLDYIYEKGEERNGFNDNKFKENSKIACSYKNLLFLLVMKNLFF